MNKKILVSIFVALTICSGLMFTLPVTMPTAEANGLPPPPDIGDTDRINFLDSILGFLGGVEGLEFASNLALDNTTAYFHATHEGAVSFSESNYYYYGLVYTGLKNNSHKIYLESNISVSDIDLQFMQNVSLLTILWDNDKSLLNWLEDLNNATYYNDSEAQEALFWYAWQNIDNVFTGDEMVIVVPTIFWKFDLDLNYEMNNFFIIDQNDNGPFDDQKIVYNDLPTPTKTLVDQAVEDDPSLAPLINNTGPVSISDSYSNFFYMISQFWLKTLYWKTLLGFIPTDFNINLVAASHRLMGVALYNDSNANGLMDIEFEYNSTSKRYYPVVDEAKYSFDLVNATSCDFSAPVVDEVNNEIQWNATLVDPTVRLNPWGVAPEQGVMMNTTKVGIDNTAFGFTFKPEAVQSGRTTDIRANVKLDHTFGEFDDPSILTKGTNDLDLAVLYATDVVEFSSDGQINENTPQNNGTLFGSGGPIDPVNITKTSSKTETLEFFLGSSRVTGLDLAGANYSIKDGEANHKANSAVVPYAFYNQKYQETGMITDGQVNQSSLDWTLNTNFSRSIGAYIITYPDFNGSKMVHDPEFSMYGSITTSAIPGFEWIYVFPGLVLIALAVIAIRKRKIKI
ncbi:MAG: hypothetical protein GF329_06390 [Candidatus Lokiarchaeota archaeon]|nr:hypothetical protein [Candidatus Lokiarchaeota archaeon]